MIPLTAVMLIGLTGCAGNNKNAGVNDNNQNFARPIGYYSNENHPNNGNGLMADNDGPLTELMDHTLGAEGKISKQQKSKLLQTRDENGNPPNPTKPLATTDRNLFQRDNRFSTSDMNYHGHMNKQLGNAGVVTDPKFQDDVSNKIRNKVATMKNVQDVRSVVYGNTVTVSVKLIDKGRAAETKKAIRKAVKPYTNGRSVTILTDEGILGRDRNYNNDIQQGGAR
jgi:spore cortex protein